MWFEKWCKEKKILSKKNKVPYFHEREIWFTSIWKNIWYEQNWKWKNFLRPVIVISKFNSNIFWGIPLTRTIKKSKYYYEFNFKDWISSFAILSQLKIYDAKRLADKAWHINKKDFKELREKIKKLI